MSQPRFAPITASLLARKGEAIPSAPKQSFAWLHEPLPAEPPQPVVEPAPIFAMEPGEKPHRIMVALSAREYEALGIAAVKKNTTRHQIARHAMDAYFGALAREFHGECRCVSDAARDGGCCRER